MWEAPWKKSVILLNLKCSIAAGLLFIIPGCYSYDPVIVRYRIPVHETTVKKSGPRYVIFRNKKYFAGMRGGTFVSGINNNGVELALSGKFAEAEVLFMNVVAEKPDEPAGYNNLGIIYEISGNAVRAFEMYSSACMKDPDNRYMRHNFLTFMDSRRE